MKISKFLSYLLRHHPESENLELNSDGFADLEQILAILNRRHDNLSFGEITMNTLQDLINQSDKVRFEITGNRIRAFYGHSIDVKIIMQKPNHLPDTLYHGTNLKAWALIKVEGIKSKERQYVHLSDDIHTAKLVARRRTIDPVILEINASSAAAEGIEFYKSGDMYLTEHVPPKYIVRLKK